MRAPLLGGRHDVRVPSRLHGVEDRVLGLLDCGLRKRDGVVRVGLGPLGVALGDPGVDLGLPGVDALSKTLDVLIPIALDLFPLAVGLAGGLLSLGAQLRRAIVSVLPCFVDHGFQLGIFLCDCFLDAAVGLLDLLFELREVV